MPRLPAQTDEEEEEDYKGRLRFASHWTHLICKLISHDEGDSVWCNTVFLVHISWVVFCDIFPRYGVKSFSRRDRRRAFQSEWSNRLKILIRPGAKWSLISYLSIKGSIVRYHCRCVGNARKISQYLRSVKWRRVGQMAPFSVLISIWITSVISGLMSEEWPRDINNVSEEHVVVG